MKKCWGYYLFYRFWGILHIFVTNVGSARKLALIYSVMGFLYACFLCLSAEFDEQGLAYLLDYRLEFIVPLHYMVGLDAIAFGFILLSLLCIFVCVLVSWDSVVFKVKEFYSLLLLVSFFLLQVFSVFDIFLFYIAFEAILIPMFLIIGIWGSRAAKVGAAYKFFMYTLLGSFGMLLSLLFIFLQIGSLNYFSLLLLEQAIPDFNAQKIIWLSFFIAFAVKLPIVPFHVWLPEAHVEAPTAGSVLLAGILLKMGGYGIMKYLLPILPAASFFFKPFVYTISIISILYASLTILRQIDIKKIIAYSSVAHMSLVTLSLFPMNGAGFEGAYYIMLVHGCIASALFVCVGILYERYKTRIINYYGGVVTVMPLFSVFFFLFILGNISFPGTGAFVAEFLIFFSLFLDNTFALAVSLATTVLAVAYNLWLYVRVFFGQPSSFLQKFGDLNERELFMLVLLLFIMLCMGVYPEFVLSHIRDSYLYPRI